MSDYLAFFRPNQELTDLIIKQNNVHISNLGLHTTLCFFPMKYKNEDNLIKELLKIKFNSFETKTLGFGEFNNGSLVLKLSRTKEFFDLHKNIFSVVDNYANKNFNKISEYFDDNYNPHITISKFPNDFKRNKKFLERKQIVSEYYLSKKSNGIWRNVATFYSD